MTNFLKYFLVWRLLIFIITGLALINYGPVESFTNILEKIDKKSFLNLPFIFPLANFDGVHYLSIAQNGYINEGRFMPLFPILINFISKIFFFLKGIEPIFIAGFLIANLSLLIALFFLNKLLEMDYDRSISRWTVAFLLFSPTAFFFGSIYSESLFLLISVLIFYFTRKRRWLIVGILGFLLAITRLSGILILPVLIYEFLKQENIKKTKKLYAAFPLILIPIGLIIYSLFCYLKWGDALYFLNAHGMLGNSRSVDSLVFFPQTVFRYLKILTSISYTDFAWWLGLLELTSFVFATVILFVGWRKKIRFSYTIFGILLMLLPASSGTFSGLPRYISVIFPIFLILALIKNKFVKFSIFTTFIILLSLFTFLFSRGYYIA